MKKILSFLLAVLLIGSLIVLPAYASGVPSEVLEASKSVVRIICEYKRGFSSGSGFVVSTEDRNILIATNYHVVEGEPVGISVLLDREESAAAEIVCFSQNKDLCVLRLKTYADIPALHLSAEGASRGDPVYAVGFPASADLLSEEAAKTWEEATITNGIVSAKREMSLTAYGAQVKLLQINADINHGNSGGPLLNEKGQVVGINTLGTGESGINGAIEVAELSDLLRDHGINILNKAHRGFPWLVVVIALAAVAAVSLAIVILKARGKGGKQMRKKEKAIELKAFMSKYPDGLGFRQTVSLLMPTAVSLKNAHADGKYHLQICPEKTQVSGDAAVLSPADLGGQSFSNGFTPPELYKGLTPSEATDVYSFGALFYYISTGIVPPNALLRETDELPWPENYPSEAKEILLRAMTLSQTERTQSVQELIQELAPYRVVQEPLQQETEQRPESHTIKKRKRLWPVLAALVLLVIVGSYFGTYLAARSAAQNEEFEKADKLLVLKTVTSLHDRRLIDYVKAGRTYTARDFQTAAASFAKLGDYMDAEAMQIESLVNYTQKQLDSNDYDGASSTCEELKALGYKDYEALYGDVQYKKGCYLLYEKKEYKKAVDIFKSRRDEDPKAAEMLKETRYLWALDLIDRNDFLSGYRTLALCKGYEDADALLESLKELIYTMGIDYYRKEDYKNAREYFDTIPTNYKRNSDYKTLLDCHETRVPSPLQLLSLLSLLGFEDAGTLYLKDPATAKDFLEGGVWKCSEGTLQWYKKDGRTWLGGTFPLEGDGSWSTKDGYLYIGKSRLYQMNADDLNTLVLISTSTGKTYVLKRQ